MHNANKVASYIGFAVRSRQVLFGLDSLRSARKIPSLVLADLSMSEANRHRAKQYADDHAIPYIETDAGFLASVLKRDNIKLVAICDAQLAQAIVSQNV